MSIHRIHRTLFVFSALVAGSSGCVKAAVIPGTHVVDTHQNRALIDVVEKYRHALEDRDAETLLSMASPRYYEDSGTPKAEDDYGYEGLRHVLANKLKMVKSLRYEIEYRNIAVRGDEAEVEVFLDGSFELAADYGDRYRRVNDYHHFVLARENDQWKFVRGM